MNLEQFIEWYIQIQIQAWTHEGSNSTMTLVFAAYATVAVIWVLCSNYLEQEERTESRSYLEHIRFTASN